jgi:hypothetical protein
MNSEWNLMSTRLALACAFATLVACPVLAGDCIRDTNGNVVCGRGQCMMDPYGKVSCAREGGGAVREQYGAVVCGIGYCAVDDMGRVWCSTKPGGGAAMDTNGKVQCLDACHEASAQYCERAR